MNRLIRKTIQNVSVVRVFRSRGGVIKRLKRKLARVTEERNILKRRPRASRENLSELSSHPRDGRAGRF